jgi:outer membrane protein assembly factor BamB
MRSILGLTALTLLVATARADDWPQWLGPRRDGVWRETGVIDTFPKEGPKKLWSAPVGTGYSGPAVTGGKVFVMDRVLAPGEKSPENAFGKPKLKGTERVLCLDEKTGREFWKHEYPLSTPSATPPGRAARRSSTAIGSTRSARWVISSA